MPRGTPAPAIPAPVQKAWLPLQARGSLACHRLTFHRSRPAALLLAAIALTACSPAQQRPRPAATNAQPTTNPHTWRMKRVTWRQNTALNAMPEWGLAARPGKDVDALAMLIPTDWTFQAGTKQGLGDCNLTTGRILFFANSPDKLSGLVVVPGDVSIWSNDRSLLQAVQANNQQFQHMQHCVIQPPAPLAGRIAQMATALNKDAHISGSPEPVPGLSDKLPAILEQANRSLAQQANGHPAPHITAEAVRVPITASDSTGSTEGYFSALQVTRTETLPNGATLTTIDIPMQVATFAPAGKYAATEPMLNAMLDSVIVDPDYLGQSAQVSANRQQIQNITRQRLNQIAANIAADNANAARQQAAIRSDLQQYSNRVHSSVAANRSAAFEHSNQQFALHMGDQAIYQDPASGHQVQMSSQYSHAWASTTGNTNEYILTDSSSYNPNGQAGSGSWSQLQVVH